jgi:hypothetical protein
MPDKTIEQRVTDVEVEVAEHSGGNVGRAGKEALREAEGV